VPLHNAGPQVLDHRVRPIEDKSLQAFGFLGLAEIDRDAALASVQRVIGRSCAVPERRAPATRVIAAVRIFDLDHLGAELGEDEPRIGRGYAVPYLDDRDPRQGLLARHLQLGFRLTRSRNLSAVLTGHSTIYKFACQDETFQRLIRD
jgi:hypothetical protein